MRRSGISQLQKPLIPEPSGFEYADGCANDAEEEPWPRSSGNGVLIFLRTATARLNKLLSKRGDPIVQALEPLEARRMQSTEYGRILSELIAAIEKKWVNVKKRFSDASSVKHRKSTGNQYYI